MLKLKNRYDDEKLCNNPDKGWYAHYYDNNIDKYCAHYDHNHDGPRLLASCLGLS